MNNQAQVDINLVMDEYQKRLSEVEKQRILNTAMVTQLKGVIKDLEEQVAHLTKENEELKKHKK